MKEMIKMVVVLTFLSSLSGWVLAALSDATKEKIEVAELSLVKGPVVQSLFEGAENDPVENRFKIMDDKTERTIFVGVFDGKPNTFAFETKANGFADKIGLMVAVNTDNDKLLGVGVTTSKETPGLGANAKTDPSFAAQFKGLSFDKPFQVTKDGGSINAISGATITSRAVCTAASDAVEVYQRIKPEVESKIKEIVK